MSDKSEPQDCVPSRSGLSQFLTYASIGIANTALHWAVFLLLVSVFETSQSLANLAGFTCAVTFSFFANARITFRSSATLGRYIGYAAFMGALAFLLGFAADRAGLPPIATLVGFSAISLGAGFLYSRFLVFAQRDIR